MRNAPFQCSTSCGVGQKSREVKCQKADSTGAMKDTDNAECKKLPKPITHERCNIFNPCPGGTKNGTYKPSTGTPEPGGGRWLNQYDFQKCQRLMPPPP